MKKMTFFTNLFFILLGPLCGILNAAETAGQNYFNVRAFGALGDGKNLDSPAIDKAIDACVQAGGRSRRNLFERLDSSQEQHPSAH
jgi:hypothetical protein